MGDGRIAPDDPASRYVPQWRDDPRREAITVRHLATHTSGIEDAEEGGLPHDRLTGWKGDFWKRLPPPHDPFTLARDRAPVLDVPGTRERYSNPGMAMLGYCVTASLRGTGDADLRSLLKAGDGAAGRARRRVVGGLWDDNDRGRPAPGGDLGRGLLQPGRRGQGRSAPPEPWGWEGRELLDPTAVETALEPGGMPGHSGLGWWVNTGPDGSRLWRSAPEDAFGGAGAGQQFLLVVPSLDLIVVRNGERLDPALGFEEGWIGTWSAPVVRAITTARNAPYPPSPVIKGVRWAPAGVDRPQGQGQRQLAPDVGR